MNLFLDDIRYPKDAANYMNPIYTPLYLKMNWKIVRNYDQFVSFIEKNGLPEIISFDHDLGSEHYELVNNKDFKGWSEYYKEEDREMTGYDCAKWLVDYCMDRKLKIPEYIIHSMNLVGSENIKRYLENAKKHINV